MTNYSIFGQHLSGIDQGLELKYLMTNPREFIAFSIIFLFAFALFKNPSDAMMVGALIGAFSTAIGYYLGAAKRDDHPQPVTVENSPSDPVPVEGAS